MSRADPSFPYRRTKMQNIDIEQAGQCLIKLVENAVGGDEVVITKSGIPVVKLTPIAGRKPGRRYGSAKGLIKMSDDFDEPLEDFREYM
jgi:prevent-host-death family protein